MPFRIVTEIWPRHTVSLRCRRRYPFRWPDYYATSIDTETQHIPATITDRGLPTGRGKVKRMSHRWLGRYSRQVT